jgi:IS30 family transposase
MLQKHITINELTNIHIYFLKGINANQCSRLMNIGKDEDWSVDAICGRDKLVESEERCSTKTLYRMVKDSLFSESKLRRKGKRKKNYQKETRGKINDCKIIHERDKKYPEAKLGIEFGLLKEIQ